MPYPESINPVSEPKFPALIGRHTKFFKRFNLLLLVLVVLLGGFRLQQITTHFIRNQSAPSDYYQYDFGAYYDAAAALNLDQSQSIYNNPEFLKTAAKQSGMRTLFSAYIYPPFFAVILRPLALVPHLQAILIWAGLNLTWLCLAIFFTFKTIGIKISKFQWLVLILFLLIFPPVYHTIIIFGQVNLLLLFLLSIVLYGARKDASFTWQIIAGIALGIGIGIKIFFVILLIYYLFYGRPRLAISAGATFLVTILIGLVGASAINTTTYFSSILFDVSKVENNFWVNLSIEPTIHRLFSIVEYEYQLPHMAEPVVATLLPIIKSATAGKILGFAGKFLFAFLAGVYFISDWFFLRKDSSQFHDLLQSLFLTHKFFAVHAPGMDFNVCPHRCPNHYSLEPFSVFTRIQYVACDHTFNRLSFIPGQQLVRISRLSAPTAIEHDICYIRYACDSASLGYHRGHFGSPCLRASQGKTS